MISPKGISVATILFAMAWIVTNVFIFKNGCAVKTAVKKILSLNFNFDNAGRTPSLRRSNFTHLEDNWSTSEAPSGSIN